MNRPCHIIVFGAISLMSMASIPALAIKLVPSSAGETTRGLPASAFVTAAKSGVIISIDIAGQSIVVGQSTYMFVPSLTKVYSSDPLANGNPLKLKPGQTIEFTTITEATGKQRIADVAVKNSNQQAD